MPFKKQKSLISVAIGMAFTGAVQAQTESNVSGPETSKLEEIIVTAERRTENLQDTATSVTVLAGDDLAREGKATLGQMLEDVPGVSGFAAYGASGAGSDTPAAGITIRGIGSNVLDANTIATPVTAAALYVDEVNNGIGGTYDIDRIEVLRGPQGTLYGRSATTGVLAVHTRNPSFDGFGGNSTAEAGNYGMYRLGAGVNLPMSDQFAVRVSGQIYKRDGYDADKGGSFQAGGSSIDTKDARVKMLYKPNEVFSLLLGAAYQDNTTHTGENTGVLVGPQTVSYDFHTPLGSGTDRSQQYWAQVDWDLGGVQLTYLPSYRTWYQNATTWIGSYARVYNGVSYPALFVRRGEAYTPSDYFHLQELRLASDNDSRLKWQTGLFYYDNKLRNRGIQYSYSNFFATDQSTLGTEAREYTADVNKRTRDLGVFGEATFSFTDALRLTAGARYDETEVEISELFISRTGTPISPDDGRKFYNPTYKVRLELDATTSTLLYASVSTGFLPGDLSVTQSVSGVPRINTFTDEVLTSYEIGTKNRFLDDTMQLNGAVYYYDYGGKQQSNINVAPVGSPPGTTDYITLSSPATVLGAELEVSWLLTTADKVGLNVGWNDAKYRDKPALFSQYVADEKITGSPDLSANLSYDHTFYIGDDTLRLGGDVLYTSDYQYQTTRPEQVAGGGFEFMRVPSKAILNLQGSWGFSKDISLTAYVRNATDKRVKNNANIIAMPNELPFNLAPGGYTVADLTAPRTYGAVLSVAF